MIFYIDHSLISFGFNATIYPLLGAKGSNHPYIYNMQTIFKLLGLQPIRLFPNAFVIWSILNVFKEFCYARECSFPVVLNKGSVEYKSKRRNVMQAIARRGDIFPSKQEASSSELSNPAHWCILFHSLSSRY